MMLLELVAGETEDSLLGRVNEKLDRTAHVLERKEQEIRENKEEMKELGREVSQVMKYQKQWAMVLVDIVEIEIFTSVITEY